jgi:GNAT superfamily N-acetyltransferase
MPTRSKAKARPSINVVPATPERWPDLETLFGPNGAAGGCWCMNWRLERASFKRLKGAGTRANLEALTRTGAEPGLLAYVNEEPVGWCSIGPRDTYAALENSRILKRVDAAPVWSIVCFFVARTSRRQGVMKALLDGAVRYAKRHDARLVEAYPIDMQSPKLAGQTLNGYGGYMGVASIFREAGFVEVGRASETQLIMRCTVR